MTRQEVLDIVSDLSPEQKQQWMFNLGSLLTISARDAYEMHEEKGGVLRLMGFNELQHQTYVCSGDLQNGRIWLPQDFLDHLIKKATYYKIDGDLGWAIRVSLSNIRK